jgi:UDPglucose 6-dehydrogenase
MKIAVIGAGYVGLVTAVGLASLGHLVRVGEADANKVALLNSGGVPLHEADLDTLLAASIAAGNLTFHEKNIEAVKGAEVVMLALPTPPATDGSADLTFLEDALRALAHALNPDVVVVTKSTVPIGTSRRFNTLLEDLGADVVVVSNPEFLREGSAVSDFLHPDRIVIGTTDSSAADTIIRMYEGIDAPFIITDPESSEMIKYASNAYLATRLTFANSLANLCEYVGADVTAVLDGVGSDHRIGSHFLKPGPGYGGSCFPKDTLALVSIADEAGYDFSLMRGVIAANEVQMERTVSKIRSAVRHIDKPRAGVWGIAFKAGTDDIRHSPAVRIAEALTSAGIEVAAYDPAISTHPVPAVNIADNALAAVEGADVLVVATEWPEFAEVDLEAVGNALRGSTIIDARNLLDPDAVKQLGLSYEGIGR